MLEVYEGLTLQAHESPFSVYTTYGPCSCLLRHCYVCGQMTKLDDARGVCEAHIEIYERDKRLAFEQGIAPF